MKICVVGAGGIGGLLAARLAQSGEEVSVRLRPPSPFESIADHLVVTSSASARSAE